MSLPSVPADILVLIYIALIDPCEKYATSVVSLAATCQRFLAVLNGTKLIWIEMFATCFDLLNHHKHADFDIQYEYKKRLLALASPARLLHGNGLHTLVTENEGRNLETLVTSPGYPGILSLLGHRLDNLLTQRNAEHAPWELLKVVGSLVSRDPSTAHIVFSKASIMRFLANERPVFSRQEDGFPSYLDVQLMHLSMVELLTGDPPAGSIDAPLPRVSATRQALENTVYPGRSVVQVERALVGEWAGYYGYGQMIHVDAAMRLSLAVMESADHRVPFPSGVPEGTSFGELNGHGVDGVGPFFINGRAWSTGEVRFSKRYVGQHAWLYQGRVTPWGIAGCWNGGPFWIWRITGL